MMNDGDAEKAGEEEASAPIVPEISGYDTGDGEAKDEREEEVPATLPGDDFVVPQVTHVHCAGLNSGIY